jgi:hypothetical protein
MTREDLLQDLSYARTLAEEGRHAPLVGGAYLILFGVLLVICYGAQYYILTTGALHQAAVGMVWFGFGLCATVGVLALGMRTRRMPGVNSVGNRAERIVWQGAALAIGAVVAGSVLRGILLGDFTATNVIMAAGFGLYGVALWATAGLSGYAWLRAFAWLAFSVSGTLWFFMDASWALLVAAIGSVLVLLIPGIIMMRGEPSKVV